jgi:hypothetical protein
MLDLQFTSVILSGWLNSRAWNALLNRVFQEDQGDQMLLWKTIAQYTYSPNRIFPN